MLRRQFDIDFQRRLEMIMDEKKAEVDTYFDENHMPTGINIDMVQKEYKVGNFVGTWIGRQLYRTGIQPKTRRSRS